MKIGIDIDDTTFLTVKSMLKYADIFDCSSYPGGHYYYADPHRPAGKGVCD